MDEIAIVEIVLKHLQESVPKTLWAAWILKAFCIGAGSMLAYDFENFEKNPYKINPVSPSLESEKT